MLRLILIAASLLVWLPQANAMTIKDAYNYCIFWERTGYSDNANHAHVIACLSVLSVWGNAATRNCMEAATTNTDPTDRYYGSFGKFDDCDWRCLARSLITFVEKHPQLEGAGLASVGMMIAEENNLRCL